MKKCKCGNDVFNEYSKESCVQTGVQVNDDGSNNYETASEIETLGENGGEGHFLECEICLSVLEPVAEKEDKIIIVVEGGCVQAVCSTNPALKVELCDWDNAEYDDEAKAKCEKLAEECKAMSGVF